MCPYFPRTKGPTMKGTKSKKDLQLEIEELRTRLEEAEETLQAIRSGEVDALVVSRPGGEQVYTLKSAESPYRMLVEQMPEGAMMAASDGTLLYCNRRFAEMVQVPLENLVGSSLFQFIPVLDQKWLETILQQRTETRMEITLKARGKLQVPVYLSVSSLETEGSKAISMVVTDLTERKQNENALLDAEAVRKSRDELEIRVRERTLDLAKVNEELMAEIIERRQTEEELRKRTYDLDLRVKEINCLYSISYYVGKEYLRLEEKLQNIVDLIPSGWQYPEISCARIVLEGKEYETARFQETSWRQASDIIVEGETAGTVEVHYLEEEPQSFEGPFLKEERSLLNSIAIELGEMTGYMRAEEARKRAEETIRLQADQHAAMLTTTPDGFWVFDTDAKLLDVNDAYCRMSGYSREEFLRLHISDIEALETPEETARHIRTVMGTGFDRFETRHRTKDGRILDVEISVSFWKATGQFVLFVRDITERKRAEEALKTVHQYNRSLIEASLDPLVTISSGGKITDVNSAAEWVTGVSRDLLIGSDFSDYFTEPEKARDGYRQVFEKGAVVDYPLAIRHISGNVTEVLYNAALYKNEAGEVQGIFAAARDITQRMRAEEAATAEHALRESIENSILTGILVVDKRGRITHVNPALCHMIGWSEEELVGTGPPFIFWPAENLESRTKSFRQLLKGRISSVGLDVRLRRKTGEHFDALVMVSSLKDDQDRASGWVASIGDITDRIESERRIYTTNVLLGLFSKKGGRREYLEAVAGWIQDWSGCRCVGIRVLDRQGFIPYESYVGFSQEFWESENWLSVQGDRCACIRVITGNPDPEDTAMLTPYGSFHCGNTFRFVGGLSEEKKSRFRGVCLENDFASVSIVPIRYREDVLGAIHLADEREGQISLKALEFIESVAPLIGEAIHRFNLEDEIRESENRLRILSSQLLTVQEDERRRISREVHDSLGQSLSAVKFRMESILQETVQKRQRTMAQSLESVVSIVKQSIEEARRIQMDLRPSVLDDLGILATITWFCREFRTTYPDIRTHIQLDIEEAEIPESLKTAIYRILQEALNNAAKHSKARRVSLSLGKNEGRIELIIQDNGQGFDLEEKPSVESTARRGLGLTSMRERTELSGGVFRIESTKGKGTTLTASWPL